MTLVRNYGLRWDVSSVDWAKREPLLGQTTQNGNDFFANFSGHSGLYAIYKRGGLHYVGRTSKLGQRLKEHRRSVMLGTQDEFSWFSFDDVGVWSDRNGQLKTARRRPRRLVDPRASVEEWEAILIYVAGPPGNTKLEPLKRTQRWVPTPNPTAVRFAQ